MALEQLETVLQHLRKLTHGADERRTDAELLGQFVARRDGDAFAELVRRHGPMVLGVCRRLLPIVQDAEDAFQATFLILVRRAASLRDPGRVGCWLYGVAFRVAREARSAQRPHFPLPEVPEPARLDEVASRELRALLDEELGRLSERDRGPLVLCDLEGRTHQDAARALGIPAGSMSRRLARSRALLRQRLARRGLALSAGTLAVLLSRHTVVAVPPALLSATINPDLLSTATSAAGAGGISVRAVALADGVLRAMAPTRLNLVALFLLVLGAAGAAAALLPGRAGDPPSTPHKAAASPPARTQLAAENRKPLADLARDPLPPGAIARMGTTRFRHGASAQAVAFSRDGKLLASADWNRHLVRVWDAATGKELMRLTGHTNAVHTVAFSSDGKTIASGSRGDIRLWDVSTGKQVHVLGKDKIGETLSVAFSPDGKTLASGGHDNIIRLWNVQTGRETVRIEGHRGEVSSVAFFPDGKVLASGSWDNSIRLWDVSKGRPVGRFEGHKDRVFSIAVSPEGKRIASGSHDKTLRLWDVDSGQELRVLDEVPGNAYSVAFSPDGTLLACGEGHGTVRLFHVKSGQKLRSLGRHAERVLAVAFAPDGTTIASGSEDNTVRLWDITTGKERLPPGGHQGPIDSVCFSPDGTLLATASQDATLRLWKVPGSGGGSSEEVRRFNRHRGRGQAVVFSPDGKLLAVEGNGEGGGVVFVYEAATGKEVAQLKGHQGGIAALAFAPDGRLASGGWDNTIRLWNVAKGEELRRLVGHAAGVVSVSFAPDGKTLASGSHDNTIRVWDGASGKQRRQWNGHSNKQVFCVAFSPDGKTLASGGADDRLRLWSTEGEELQALPAPESWVESVAFAPDGQSVASGSYDGVVRVWEMASGKLRLKLQGHEGRIRSLSFASDGRRLASGSWDTTALVWDVSGAGPDKPAAQAELAPKQRDALWADLASDNAAVALRAIARLTGFRDQAVAVLKERLKPVPLVDAQRVARLIADLGDRAFKVRAKASDELEKLGDRVEPLLRKELAGQSDRELVIRLQRILETIEGQGVPAERLRGLRGIEVLERIGTAKAKDVLRSLADGAPGARETKAARAALKRLSQKN